MRANLVVVVGIALDRSSQVMLTQDDCVIQALSPNRANNTLGVSVLPRRGWGRQNFRQSAK